MNIVHELPLVSTVAMGLSLAFVLGLAASMLRISPIVGYLIAGIVIGPHTPGFVGDMKIAEELSEIGIVLLMFGVGLHFSLKDFAEVRRIALTGALTRIAAATALGAWIGHSWGWSWTGGILFGLSLSVASTVVLLRSFEQRNMLQTLEGHISIGWLIVEDMVMLLMMVFLPALSGSGAATAGWADLAVAVGKVATFICVMFVAGRRVLPWLLTIATRTGSRELFTLAVVAMAMGIAFGAASLFGVSFALGAFFAGMMIRESDLNHEVANRALPFQDAFAVLFFVSVGMLFDPAILGNEPAKVLAAAAVIMFGKSLVSLAVIRAFRYSTPTALTVSAGLAQIGEFSFVLAALGVSQGLLPPEGRDVILAGAIVSIVFNPALLALARLLSRMARIPRLSGRFNLRDDALAHLRTDERRVLKDLVILVGYGRVGKHVAENIHAAHVDLVIVDANREKAADLRKRGFHAIAGDATQAGTLNEAEIAKARAVVVTIPDPFEARRVVEAARKLKPSVKVLVKAQNDEELDYFERHHVDLAVAAPREIGRRMIEYINGMKA